MDKQKKLETIYSKVVKDFPDVDKNDIKINYDRKSEYCGCISIVDLSFWNWLIGRYVWNPLLEVNPEFFMFPEDEQEAIIAHELGHYLRHRDNKHKEHKLKDYVNWISQYCNVDDSRHSWDRLAKWHIMHELDADTQAALAGYGEGLLNFFERRKFGSISSFFNNELELRIYNLEYLLKE